MNPILRDIPETIEFERLLIRTPLPGDGVALNRAILASWAELRPWMIWAGGDQPTVAESEEYVRTAHCNFLARKDLPLVLLLKNTGELIGGSGLHNIDWEVPKFEIGYWLHSGHTRQGYATEAVDALTRLAFDVLGARRVEIHCDRENVRSAAVPKRLGFSHEATLHNHRRHHLTKALVDLLIFAQTRPDPATETPGKE